MKYCYFLLFALATHFSAAAQQNFPVRFDFGTVYFPENFSEALKKNEITASELVNGRYVRYIQCARIPGSAERMTAESAGVQFLGFLQVNTYLVSLPASFDLSRLESLHVRSIVPVQGDWKLAKTLREQPYGDWAVHGDKIDLNLQVYPHVGIARGAEWCRQNGMSVLQEGNQNGQITVRVPVNKLLSISELPFVQYLELIPPPSVPDDLKGRGLHRSNLVDSDHALGKHYNGTGVDVLVRDDGIVGPHADFKGRLDNISDVDGGINHGDYVAGCVGGAGNIDPKAKGMAAGSNLHIINYTVGFQDETLDLHLDKNVTITNTSYTDGCNKGYTMASQTVDQQMFEHPRLTHVFSAGNSGETNCSYGAGAGWGNITGGHKMAKNAVTVANLTADGSLVASSSRGPAYDGRLKPDISAHGNDVYMTQPNNIYDVNSGTSFSAPAVAGCLAQLTQAYKTIHNGEEPASALLKATIYNTASEMGNIGPDFRFGWGLINTGRALQLLEENRWTTGQSEQGTVSSNTVTIPPGTKLAKIMVYWPEAPAMPNAAVALLNDLDLSVTAPDNSEWKPWLLDPTPNVLNLNTPATHGRDSLNNVEQVAIDNPVAGTYTVNVSGTAVPFGPQPYVLVWEFLNDAVKMTYPNGGEGFAQNSTERIQWDAYGVNDDFNLQYSVNDGASWIPIATVNADKRMYDWPVPNVQSGKVKLMVQRGNQSDTTDFALSIAPVPLNLSVTKVCPDSMSVSWFESNDTLQYDVYLLGAKYMEIVGTATTDSLTFPIQNAGLEQWFSVRTSYPDGLNGPRAYAVNWPGGLKNCPQAQDLALTQLLSPDAGGILSCSPTERLVSARVRNAGGNMVSGASIYYQFGAAPVVAEPLPDIAVDSFLDYTFQMPLQLTDNSLSELKIWTALPADIAKFNDTLKVNLSVAVAAVGTFFSEDFESSPLLPLGWTIKNPDNEVTWTLQKTSGLIGTNGTATRAARLNCFDYSANGEEDYLYLIPLIITVLDTPSLIFDVAHAQYNNESEDGLRVDVFPACDLNAAPVVIWEKSGATLATDASLNSAYTPNSKFDWRTEVVSLSQFAGQTIVVRFASVNAYGNNIYLDNIGIGHIAPTIPAADFSASVDSICRLDTVYFKALTSDPDIDFDWSFGVQASPASASGPGPHLVRYLTPGDKTITLIASNPFGADTSTQSVFVLNFPSATYTVQINDLTATFNNTSVNALSYLWDFGDNSTSTLASPVHTYAGPGTYAVKLTATNDCKATVKTTTLDIGTSGVQDLSGLYRVRILPNPTEADFRVELQAIKASGSLRLQLFNAQGRLVKKVKTAVKQEITMIPFEGLHLPKGMYQLQVLTDEGMETYKVVIQ